MDPLTDPDVITVKVTAPGPDGEPVVRKFKVGNTSLQKDVIHKTVLILASFSSNGFKLTFIS